MLPILSLTVTVQLVLKTQLIAGALTFTTASGPAWAETVAAASNAAAANTNRFLEPLMFVLPRSVAEKWVTSVWNPAPACGLAQPYGRRRRRLQAVRGQAFVERFRRFRDGLEVVAQIIEGDGLARR